MSIHSQPDLSDAEHSDLSRSAGNHSSFGLENGTVADAPPRASLSGYGIGSEHGSQIPRRSISKQCSGGESNAGARHSQQGKRGILHGATNQSRSGGGSNLGKSVSGIHDAPQGDEESVFVPGGFVHRGAEKMRLEGRSLKIFSPQNPLRLWLGSILKSKYG